MEQVNRDELERAAKRIMEMNSKAQSVITAKKETTPLTSPLKETAKEKRGQGLPISSAPQKHNSVFDIINFKNIVGDSDRTLLVGIMLLLGAEMADEKLMLALLYIML